LFHPSATDNEDEKVQINMGIAIVVPAKKILEVLNQPALVEKRRLAEQARIASHEMK
jgi:hypothetical protein